MAAYDAEQIRDGLAVLVEDGDLHELRIPDFEFKKKNVLAGWFSDRDQMACWLAHYSTKCPGVFLTVNPVQGEVIKPQFRNVMFKNVKRATNDSQISRRTQFLIDIDPVRVDENQTKLEDQKVCATDSEKAKARSVMLGVLKFLTESGWPGAYIIDSGNGSMLRYLVNLPNDLDTKRLSRDALAALAAKFPPDGASIDTTVFNASRICKMPGTMNCKGENTAERPWRMSRISRYGTPAVVDMELLKALAALMPPLKAMSKPQANGTVVVDDEDSGGLIRSHEDLRQRLHHFHTICPEFQYREAHVGGEAGNCPGFEVTCPAELEGEWEAHGTIHGVCNKTMVWVGTRMPDMVK